MRFTGKTIKLIEGQFGSSSDYAVLVGEDGKAIGKFNPDDQIVMKEIMRRWNLHEELLKSLKDLVDSIEGQLGCTDTGSQTEDDWSDLPAARSVIAKAENK
jgi:hypothetical protein